MFIEANGMRLFYKKSGSGKPMALLHGNGEDHHIFDAISEKLRDHFTLYALDSRNHGESERSPDVSYGAMAEDLHAFIQKLSIAPALLFGFSDGAIISLLLAMKHPGDVEKMALLGANLSPEDLTPSGRALIEKLHEETKSPLVKLILEEPHISPDELRKIQIPAWVLAGENDIFKPEAFTAIAEALPNSALRIMKGHGHESYIVNSDLLWEDAVKFFK